MNYQLLSKIDNGIRRLSSLNALVERVVERIAPRMTAAAVNCVVPFLITTCQTGGYWTGTCGQCGGGTCYFRWEGSYYLYPFGYRKATNFQKKTYCSPPSPNIDTCNSNCS